MEQTLENHESGLQVMTLKYRHGHAFQGMITRPFSSRLRHPAIVRLAAITLVGLIWGGAAFCGEIQDAARQGDLNRIKALLSKHPDLVSSKDANGWTPLVYAVFGRHKEAAGLLLANGANANERVGGTTLLEAMVIPVKRNPTPDDEKATRDIVALLLANKATVNAGDRNTTALHWAVDHKELLQLLLAYNADVNARDADGRTPLFNAAENNCEAAVGLLLLNKADANAADIFGRTPLHCAAQWGREDIAKLLLANQADLNAKEKGDGTPLECGGTPLHLAAQFGHRGMVELLLAHGAEINAKANNGWTPLHVAEYFAKHDIATLLRQHGGHE